VILRFRLSRCCILSGRWLSSLCSILGRCWSRLSVILIVIVGLLSCRLRSMVLLIMLLRVLVRFVRVLVLVFRFVCFLIIFFE